eukprot:6255617-Alexandrium_andersonii.AAC.1
MEGAMLIQGGPRGAGVGARPHHGGEGTVDSRPPPAIPGGRASRRVRRLGGVGKCGQESARAPEGRPSGSVYDPRMR